MLGAVHRTAPVCPWQCAGSEAIEVTRPYLMHPHRDHFVQHSEAVVEKAHLTSCRIIPAHGNFADAQSGTLREIKQLDVEGKAIDPSGF